MKLKTEQTIISQVNHFTFQRDCQALLDAGWTIIPQSVRASENSYVAFFQRVIVDKGPQFPAIRSAVESRKS